MRWPFTTKRRMMVEVQEARRVTRRRLIQHLRANSRGVALLDGVVVAECEIPGPVSVFGDHVFLMNNTIRSEP